MQHWARIAINESYLVICLKAGRGVPGEPRALGPALKGLPSKTGPCLPAGRKGHNMKGNYFPGEAPALQGGSFTFMKYEDVTPLAPVRHQVLTGALILMPCT